MNQTNHHHGRLICQQQQRDPVFPEKPTPDSEVTKKRRSTTTSLSSSMKLTKPKVKKQVTFSEFSSLCVYPLDRQYESIKSYKSAERKAFQRQAATDSERIQQLIASDPTQDSNVLIRILQANVLQIEDLLGLENLIHEKGKSRLIKLRRGHTASLMRKQEELKEKHIQDEYLLASAVVLNSVNSFEKARLRAALAA